MATNTEKILAGALVAFVIVAAIVAVTYNYTIHNTGTINVIGFSLWTNVNRTTALTVINWGTLNPGDTKGVSAWAQNTGNVNVTLSSSVFNWSPATAPQYLTFNWNYTGSKLLPGQLLHLLLTLAASPSITGITNFSFDINMTSKGVS